MGDSFGDGPGGGGVLSPNGGVGGGGGGGSGSGKDDGTAQRGVYWKRNDRCPLVCSVKFKRVDG